METIDGTITLGLVRGYDSVVYLAVVHGTDNNELDAINSPTARHGQSLC